MIDILIVLGALTLLIVGAYRGYSVILLAPAAAMLALLLIDPSAVPAVFSGLYMEKLAGFVKLYFPVFLLGAVFGKLIEVSRLEVKVDANKLISAEVIRRFAVDSGDLEPYNAVTIAGPPLSGRIVFAPPTYVGSHLLFCRSPP